MTTDLARAMTEAQLLDAVIAFARLSGWLVDHPRPARTSNGWRTAIQGDAGRPDLLMVHPTGRVLIVELKTETGRLTAAQRAWGEALHAAGQRAAVMSPTPLVPFAYYTWRPSDWLSGHIREVLGR